MSNKRKHGLLFILTVILIFLLAGPVQCTSLTVKLKSPDINGDNTINIADILLLVSAFNTVSGDGKYKAEYDLNSDNVINICDVMIIAVQFNTVINSTNTPTPVVSGGKAGLVTLEDGFTYYYKDNSEMVKSDYVKIDDNTIYYFCENGRGFKQTIKVLNKNLIELFDNGITAAFLAIGDKKAVLIDGQTGLGNLKKLASLLTDKPIDMILTHGHEDHIGAAFTFDEVYLNPEDNGIFKYCGNLQMRYDFAASTAETQSRIFNIDYNSIMSINDFQQYKEVELLPVFDGQIFDLGGLTIEAIHTPGHTPGSTAFLLKEPRILISGDSANSYTLIMETTVEEYRKTLLKFKSREKEWDTIYTSHGIMNSQAPITLFDELLEACNGVMDGTIKGVPAPDGPNALLAYETDQSNRRLDGKFGNIVYDKNKIFNEK